MKKWICILLVLSATVQAMSKATPVPSSIGVKTIEYVDESRSRPVLVELWYPTEQKEPVEEVSDVWVHPKEVREAALSTKKEKWPLVVLSHGHYGDRRDRSWIAEYLVKQGFLVASVEHHGNTWRAYNPLMSLRFWERPKDVTFAIDHLFHETFLEGKIDADRIGFVGYSLGGMTGLALAGAQAKNIKEIAMRQQAGLKEFPPEVLQEMDFTEGHANFSEPRIKAMVLICPATFVYPTQILKEIKTPIGLVVSAEDEVLPHAEHGNRLIEALKPKKLKLLKNISHHAFLNKISEKGKKVLRAEVVTCQRDPLHKEVGEFIVDFFKTELAEGQK